MPTNSPASSDFVSPAGNQLNSDREIGDLVWELVADKTADEAFPILRDRVSPAVDDSRLRSHLETAHTMHHMIRPDGSEPAAKLATVQAAPKPEPPAAESPVKAATAPKIIAPPEPPTPKPAPEPPMPALVAAPAPEESVPKTAVITVESFEDLLWDKIWEQMGDDPEAIPPDSVMCILDDLDYRRIAYPDGLDQFAVRALIKKLDAERRGVEDEPRPKPNGKPRAPKAGRRNDRRVPGFQADNSSETWMHCKAPFLRFMVSNQRRVAWAVDAGHGAYRGKILTLRGQLVWANGKPVAVTCVRLYDDEGRRVERNVEFLYQNAVGRPQKARA